jgi:hypothetical protein
MQAITLASHPHCGQRVEHKDVRHQIQRLDDDVCGAIAVWRLELIANTARGYQ